MSWLKLAGDIAKPFAGEINRRFTTVLGDTVYLPGPVESFSRTHLAAVLAHELVHQIDQSTHGLGFYASYVLAGPALRTRRAHWERRAYAVDLMLAYEDGGQARLDVTLDRLVEVFCGPSYAFMWAGRDAARRYLAPIAAGVVDGSLARRAPYDEILAAWRGDEEVA